MKRPGEYFSKSEQKVIEAVSGITQPGRVPATRAEAAEIAGVSTSCVSEVLSRPDVQESIVDALNHNGFSDAEIAQRLGRYCDRSEQSGNLKQELKGLELVCKLKKHINQTSGGISAGAVGAGAVGFTVIMQKVLEERKARGLTVDVESAEIVDVPPKEEPSTEKKDMLGELGI